MELLERLAALTPRPRINLVLYHGVLAPRAAWRKAVVPPGTIGGGGSKGPRDPPVHIEGSDPDTERSPNRTWAELMQRSFGFDVLACPRCPGRLMLVALIRDPVVVLRILRHLGLPHDVPTMRSAREPPLPFDGHDDHGSNDDY